MHVYVERVERVDSFPCVFLTVKEVFKGEVQPLGQLPHCHNVEGIVNVCICVCTLFVCV